MMWVWYCFLLKHFTKCSKGMGGLRVLARLPSVFMT